MAVRQTKKTPQGFKTLVPSPSRVSVDTKPCPAQSTTILVEIKGAGRILGGRGQVHNQQNQKHNYFILRVDGIAISSERFDDLLNLGAIRSSDAMTFLTRYDEENGYFDVGIKEGITFEESFKIEYVNESETQADISYWLWYALL